MRSVYTQIYLSSLIILVLFTSACKVRKKSSRSEVMDCSTMHRHQPELMVQSVKLLAWRWKQSDMSNRTITLYKKGNYDSCVITYGETAITTFNAKSRYIITPEFTEKDDINGRWITYKLCHTNIGYGMDAPNLFGFFYGAVLSETHYHPNGMIKMQKLNTYYGSDSVVRKWTTLGIIESYSDQFISYSYYPSGVLQLEAHITWPRSETRYNSNGTIGEMWMDTMIKGHYLRYVKLYKEGVLSKEQYFDGDTEVHTWAEYNSKGALTKTIVKSKLSQLPEQIGQPDLLDPDKMYMNVEQMANYPGGEDKLTLELNLQVNRALIDQGNGDVIENVSLTFSVDENGEMMLRSMSGCYYEQSLFITLGKYIKAMPKWRPAQLNGRPITSLYTVKLVPMDESSKRK
ncbi:MAG: hypothetical protein V4613_14830 [Bacteroidota bacterium]